MQVSVGLPFFNAAPTLGMAIASVQNQSLEDWELILLDDGSTDGSLAVAGSALSDPRIRLISDGVNRGLICRLNQLARLARAPVLARMDADDVMHPDRLRLQLQFLIEEGADVIGSSAYVMDERLRVVGLRRSVGVESRKAVLRGGGFIHPSCLGRTRWFLDHPYDEEFFRAEDMELWARTAGSARFRALEIPLLFYRESSTPNLQAYRASWRSARRALARYGPGALGRVELAARMARSHAADLLYRLAAPIPQAQRGLLQRRNSPVSDVERRMAEAVLARAIQPARPPSLERGKAAQR